MCDKCVLALNVLESMGRKKKRYLCSICLGKRWAVIFIPLTDEALWKWLWAGSPDKKIPFFGTC